MLFPPLQKQILKPSEHPKKISARQIRVEPPPQYSIDLSTSSFSVHILYTRQFRRSVPFRITTFHEIDSHKTTWILNRSASASQLTERILTLIWLLDSHSHLVRDGTTPGKHQLGTRNQERRGQRLTQAAVEGCLRREGHQADCP